MKFHVREFRSAAKGRLLRRRLTLLARKIRDSRPDHGGARMQSVSINRGFCQSRRLIVESAKPTTSRTKHTVARVVLARLNYRPARETIAQATDRLSSLSSTERRRLLEASRAAERRARAIREALAKKAAEESADKWTRE